jgi:membrane associated rhomboid family serine protease
MGEADRYQDYKRPKTHFRLGDDGNALVTLFAINVVMFLILLLIEVGYDYSQREAFYNAEVVSRFALPGSFSAFIQKPWTLLVYMFGDIKVEIIRLLSNMIWLWAFGSLLQQMAGNRQLIPIYIYGGVVGGIFFMLAHAVIPAMQLQSATASLLGANTGVMAVAMATTSLSPNFRFFRHIGAGIPIWILMAVYIFIDLAGLTTMHAAYSIAHLGAALAGFLFVVLLRKGTDAGEWMNRSYTWLTTMFEPNKKPSSQNIREKVFYETGGRKPFHKTSHVTQQRIDEILDKINQKGYDQLTEEEKQLLKKASEDGDL